MDYSNPVNSYIQSLIEAAKGVVSHLAEQLADFPNATVTVGEPVVTESTNQYDNRVYTWVNDEAAEEPTRHMQITGDYAKTVECTVTQTVTIVDDIAINETNFPDKSFRAIVKTFDTSGNDMLSVAEIAAVTEIDCFEKSISSLEGIEFFTALERLHCGFNDLTTLDVSNNKLLEYLSCSSNSLTVLNVSNNTVLETLYCNFNKLTGLDVSNNTALRNLNCSDNLLTSLDVTGLSALTSFNAAYNTYSITVGADRTLDLTTLPGSFDVSKASNWNGGTVSGNTLTVNEGADKVTYTYDCGEGKNATFTLIPTVSTGDITRIDVTVTPPAVGATPADTAAVVSTPENSAVFRKLSWYLASGAEFDDFNADVFESGNVYAVGIYVTPKDDFAFSEERIVYCNGKEIPYYSSEIDKEGGSYFLKDGKEIYLWIVFDALTNSETQIDTVEITGATLSYNVGDAPKATAVAVDSDKYEIEYEKWEEVDPITGQPLAIWQSDGGHSSASLPAISAFEAGKTYTYSIVIKAKGSNTFAENATLKVNGSDVSISCIGIHNNTPTGSRIVGDQIQTIKPTQAQISYQIIEGANGIWTQNSDGTLTFRANGDFSKFTGVKVDGTLIDASNYTAVSGSTVVTLKADYLKTLSVGTHTLTIVYNDGECSTNFEIKTSQSQNTGTAPTEPNTPTTPSDADKTNPDTGVTSPQTGDNSHLALWIAMLFVSGACVLGTALYNRRNKYSAK